MRFVFAAIALFCLCCSVAVGQTQENLITMERVIKKLPPVGTDPELDAARCGDYLMYWADPKGVTPKGPRIGYILESTPGDPPKTSFVFTFLRYKFVIVKDSSKTKPTAQAQMRDGTVTSIIIRMSSSDHAKATCLRK